MATDSDQHLLTQHDQSLDHYIQVLAQPQPQDHQQQGSAPSVPSQTCALLPSHGWDQLEILTFSIQEQTPKLFSSRYVSPYDTLEKLRSQRSAEISHKRNHLEALKYSYHHLQQLQGCVGSVHTPISVDVTHQNPHVQLQLGVSYQIPSQRSSPQKGHSRRAFHTLPSQSLLHHHHHLPNQPPRRKAQRIGYDEMSSSIEDRGPPSVIGQPGMPRVAARSKGRKLKFTPKDDALLLELKQTKNLTWTQIAEFFPGRSAGTLQVRYCTKLKARTSIRTDEKVCQGATAAKSNSTEGACLSDCLTTQSS